MPYGGIFDVSGRRERLEEVECELAESDIWSDAPRAEVLARERAALETVVSGLDRLLAGLGDVSELAEIAAEEDDAATLGELDLDLQGYAQELEILEFRRMFSGELDEANAYVDIQSGSGGTEAQDWAEMLLRRYLRWGETR